MRQATQRSGCSLTSELLAVLLRGSTVVMAVGLPGTSIPIIVEPLELPQPAREIERDDGKPEPAPAPAAPVKEPASV